MLATTGSLPSKSLCSSVWFYSTSAQCPKDSHATVWMTSEIIIHRKPSTRMSLRHLKSTRSWGRCLSPEASEATWPVHSRSSAYWQLRNLSFLTPFVFTYFPSIQVMNSARKEGKRGGGREKREVGRHSFSGFCFCLDSPEHSLCCSCLLPSRSYCLSASLSFWRMDVRTPGWKSNADRFKTWLGQLLSDTFWILWIWAPPSSNHPFPILQCLLTWLIFFTIWFPGQPNTGLRTLDFSSQDFSMKERIYFWKENWF